MTSCEYYIMNLLIYYLTEIRFLQIVGACDTLERINMIFWDDFFYNICSLSNEASLIYTEHVHVTHRLAE